MIHIQEGQVWDDVFGRYTWEVLCVGHSYVFVRARNYAGGLEPIERAIPIQAFEPGRGWRLMA